MSLLGCEAPLPWAIPIAMIMSDARQLLASASAICNPDSGDAARAQAQGTAASSWLPGSTSGQAPWLWAECGPAASSARDQTIVGRQGQQCSLVPVQVQGFGGEHKAISLLSAGEASSIASSALYRDSDMHRNRELCWSCIKR